LEEGNEEAKYRLDGVKLQIKLTLALALATVNAQSGSGIILREIMVALQ